MEALFIPVSASDDGCGAHCRAYRSEGRYWPMCSRTCRISSSTSAAVFTPRRHASGIACRRMQGMDAVDASVAFATHATSARALTSVSKTAEPKSSYLLQKPRGASTGHSSSSCPMLSSSAWLSMLSRTPPSNVGPQLVPANFIVRPTPSPAEMERDSSTVVVGII